MHTPDPILGLMDRFTAAINAHDLDAVLALVTEDIVFESTSPPPTAPAAKAAPP
jgi:ketosteroid isomerase-like protein